MSLTILWLDFRKQVPPPSLPHQWVRRGRSAPNLSLKLLTSSRAWCCQCFLSDRIREPEGTHLEQISGQPGLPGVDQQEVLLQSEHELLRKTETLNLHLQGKGCSGSTHLYSAHQTAHLILPASTCRRRRKMRRSRRRCLVMLSDEGHDKPVVRICSRYKTAWIRESVS